MSAQTVVKTRTFKDLIVWQKAYDLVKSIYEFTACFPSEEKYALTQQMRRAVVAIPSNIAEGYGRQFNKEYKQFLSIAYGSLCELETQYLLAVDLGYGAKSETVENLLRVPNIMIAWSRRAEMRGVQGARSTAYSKTSTQATSNAAIRRKIGPSLQFDNGVAAATGPSPASFLLGVVLRLRLRRHSLDMARWRSQRGHVLIMLGTLKEVGSMLYRMLHPIR